MHDTERTFIDPKTGEEIGSTWLARVVAFYSVGVGWLLSALIFIVALFVASVVGALINPNPIIVWRVFEVIFFGLQFFLSLTLKTPDIRGINDTAQNVHDFLSRRHLGHIIPKQDNNSLPPLTALSRALPSAPPQPTDGSVSQADSPKEEQPRLAGAVEENSERQPLWQRLGSGLL